MKFPFVTLSAFEAVCRNFHAIESINMKQRSTISDQDTYIDKIEERLQEKAAKAVYLSGLVRFHKHYGIPLCILAGVIVGFFLR